MSFAIEVKRGKGKKKGVRSKVDLRFAMCDLRMEDGRPKTEDRRRKTEDGGVQGFRLQDCKIA